jgi:hypothetical protein
MSVGQGFVHIIVYDENSVETAIADALNNNNNNMRVYYPSETDDDDMNAIIKQFVDQLLSREGSWRPPGNPCARFELSTVFSMICKDPTLEMFGGDQDDGEEGDIGDRCELNDGLFFPFMTFLDLLSATTDDQDSDRARILMWLEQIDSRFLDFKPVENLTIDFTQEYACSIAAQETAADSSASPTRKVSVTTFFLLTPDQVALFFSLKIMNKRARSDDPVPKDQPPAPKKKKKNYPGRRLRTPYTPVNDCITFRISPYFSVNDTEIY